MGTCRKLLESLVTKDARNLHTNAIQIYDSAYKIADTFILEDEKIISGGHVTKSLEYLFTDELNTISNYMELKKFFDLVNDWQLYTLEDYESKLRKYGVIYLKKNNQGLCCEVIDYYGKLHKEIISWERIDPLFPKDFESINEINDYQFYLITQILSNNGCVLSSEQMFKFALIQQFLYINLSEVLERLLQLQHYFKKVLADQHSYFNEVLTEQRGYFEYLRNQKKKLAIKRQEQASIISNLSDICDEYNLLLCQNHTLVLKKSIGDEGLMEYAHKIAEMRAAPFLKICDVLSRKISFERKMAEISILVDKLQAISESYPFEEEIIRSYQKTSRFNLMQFFCVPHYNSISHDESGYFVFFKRVRDIIGRPEHSSSFTQNSTKA